MTILLCSYPGPGWAASSRALFALHRTGFGEPPRRRGRWWALTPPFHPYRRRLRRCVGGGLLSVPLSVGFRRLACASVLPCGARNFLEAARAPRSPGLQVALPPRFEERPDTAGQDALAARKTLERRT